MRLYSPDPAILTVLAEGKVYRVTNGYVEVTDRLAIKSLLTHRLDQWK
jgi:hypothetical protein